ncbi:MAG: dihydroxyacetone kinase [Clostridiales bacterium]|nr:MAG: dihydroxyacetone kinase [Clostridiales bacterium]
MTAKITVGGKTLYTMLVSAANTLENNKTEINNLNVFPVPDGDTGTNMSLTLGAVREIEPENESVSECATKAADAVLRSARGNSGAILALFFRGFSKSVKGKRDADTEAIAQAFEDGKNEAYKAVMNPTEGTILTVIRRCAEEAKKAQKKFTSDISGFFSQMVKTAEKTLEKTPDQLPVLKEANVVDAGGKGFVMMLRGMLSALKGKPVKAKTASGESSPVSKADFSEFHSDDIRFNYCTECIIEKKEAYHGEGTCTALSDYIGTIGDSAVFVDAEDIVKLHIHTNDPGLVLTQALVYGSLTTVKIENMKKQYSALAEIDENPQAKPSLAKPEKKYGFVAVCMGDGLRDTFRDFGVDEIVYGGQTMNPSMQELLDAVSRTPAETVFILPNNKNIDMVATEAAGAVADKNVIVLHTKSVPEGISALLAFDEDASPEGNTDAMSEAFGKVKTLSVTHAVRDASVGGITVKAGQALGLLNGKIRAVGENSRACIEKLLDTVRDAAYISVFYGEDVTEDEAHDVEAMLADAVHGAEVLSVYGGQPLYDYIISIE